VRGGAKLARTLVDHFSDALLFRTLATLALDAPTVATIDELRWTGPTDDAVAVAGRLDAPDLVTRARALERARAPQSR
jgi:hypothetical protein